MALGEVWEIEKVEPGCPGPQKQTLAEGFLIRKMMHRKRRTKFLAVYCISLEEAIVAR